jgi:hypothetical protein
MHVGGSEYKRLEELHQWLAQYIFNETSLVKCELFTHLIFPSKTTFL